MGMERLTLAQIRGSGRGPAGAGIPRAGVVWAHRVDVPACRTGRAEGVKRALARLRPTMCDGFPAPATSSGSALRFTTINVQDAAKIGRAHV